jgi:hypothetical protein
MGKEGGNLEYTCYQWQSKRRKSNTLKLTNAFILPWAAFWTAVPLSPDFGIYLALVITAAIPVFSVIRKLTVYDTSVFCVVVLSVLTLIGFILTSNDICLSLSNKAGLFLIDICNSKCVLIYGNKRVEYLD